MDSTAVASKGMLLIEAMVSCWQLRVSRKNEVGERWHFVEKVPTVLLLLLLLIPSFVVCESKKLKLGLLVREFPYAEFIAANSLR